MSDNFDIYMGSRGEFLGNIVSSLATNIRAAREKRGWTQTQLAAEAGVGEKTVTVAESGSNIGMSIQTLLSLCWALEMQPAQLFGFMQTRPSITSSEYQLILFHRKLFQI